MKWKCHLLSPDWLCNSTDWSWPGSSHNGVSRQESWSGWPFPSPGNLPYPRIPSPLHCRQFLYHLSHPRRLLPCIHATQQLSDMFLVYLSHSVYFLDQPEEFRRVRKSFLLPATISSPPHLPPPPPVIALPLAPRAEEERREDTDRMLPSGRCGWCLNAGSFSSWCWGGWEIAPSLLQILLSTMAWS